MDSTILSASITEESAAGGSGPQSMVGRTPLLWVPESSADHNRGYWAKLEGHNPNGMKDRPALHMVERARDRGDLQPGAMIVESTSGTMGLGLALAGIMYRHPVTVVTDAGLALSVNLG